MTTGHHIYMAMAIAAAEKNLENRMGGPFGAVIVKDDTVIAFGNNRVTSTNDPTAHAEIVAIREAGKALGTFDLNGCTIYSSCEPCPMCLCAILWARIDTLYFAADRNDAKDAGFDDDLFYHELNRISGQTLLHKEQIMQAEAQLIFREWKNLVDVIRY